MSASTTDIIGSGYSAVGGRLLSKEPNFLDLAPPFISPAISFHPLIGPARAWRWNARLALG